MTHTSQPATAPTRETILQRYRDGDDAARRGLEETYGRTLLLPAIPYDAAAVRWIDLGLPSGRLWAARPAEGLYSWDEAVAKFQDDLPKASALLELLEECTVDTEERGLLVTGPNGNTILLPYTYDSPAKRSGQYWTATAAVPKPGGAALATLSARNARHLAFQPGYILPAGSNSRHFLMGVVPARMPR